MLEPWNDKSVLPPPTNTFQCNENISIDIANLKHICNSIIKVLSKQSPLHKESAIFSRFLYKFDKKFRNDIGYRYFKKVNSGLRKYLSLTLIKDTHNFMDLLPEKDDTIITLCSKQAAVFYLDRIKRGESHWMCLMPYALLSRVWSMGLVLLQHSCNWYKQLYSYLNKLVLKGLNFLPNQFNLPLDLEECIGIKHINEHRFEWSQKSTINFGSFIEEDNEGDLCENILKYVENINRRGKAIDEPDIQFTFPKYEINIQEVSVNKSDAGEAVSRESYKLLSTKLPPILTNPSVAKVRQDHSIKNVTDRDSLNEFVDNEDTLRNQSDKKSLTSHLSFMQWQALKNTLLKLDSELVNKRKLERKVQKIWEEKCLAYI
ncbi:unnamed protein product, partial [Brenthis ino]